MSERQAAPSLESHHLLLPNPKGRSKGIITFCLHFLEKCAAGGKAPHLTFFSSFRHGLIHVLEASFLPHLPLTVVDTQLWW